MKLQSEVKEWTLLPDGQLVETAATKKHSGMDEDDITDNLPPDSYIFSNDKAMLLKKKDFEDIIVSESIPDYEEGKKPSKFKQNSFSSMYFNKNKHTPAEIIKNIQKTHAIITDEEQKHNPFIQLANTMNLEERIPAVELIKEISEHIKPVEEEEIQQYQYGGETYEQKKQRQRDNRDATGQGMLKGAGAGASAGATIGSFFGPGPGTLIGAGIGTVVGSIAGGIGAYATSNKSSKYANRRSNELEQLYKEREARRKEMDNAAMLTTAAKFAMPLPDYKRKDYSEPIRNIDNTLDNIYRDYEQQKQNALAIGTSTNNSTLRNLRGSGLNSAQMQNLSANIAGNNMQIANQVGLDYSNRGKELMLSGLDRKNPLIIAGMEDDVNLTNVEKDALYNRNVSGINEFGTNRQASLGREDQLAVDKFSSKYALENANAAYKDGKMGQWDNTMLGVSNSIQGIGNAYNSANNLANADLTGKFAVDFKGQLEPVMDMSNYRDANGLNITTSGRLRNVNNNFIYEVLPDGTLKRVG